MLDIKGVRRHLLEDLGSDSSHSSDSSGDDDEMSLLSDRAGDSDSNSDNKSDLIMDGDVDSDEEADLIMDDATCERETHEKASPSLKCDCCL
jgi:hypothetical protein